MRVTLHMKTEFALAAAILLGSCGSDPFAREFSDSQRDEIADIAGDGAIDPDEFANLQERVGELETKLAEQSESSRQALDREEAMLGSLQRINTRLGDVEGRLRMY